MTTPPQGGRANGSAAAAVPVALGGLARTFTRVVGAVALDASSGVARLGEAARAATTGRPVGPATLRVRVVILRDEAGAALCSPDEIRPATDLADRVLREHAGIRVRVLDATVVPAPAPTAALDTSAHRRLLLDDILGRTALFRDLADQPMGGLGIGGPITVVVVRSIAGRVTGCSLGINADWVIVERRLFDRTSPTVYDETVLAHELGHALNLPHLRDRQNLMFPESSAPDRKRGTGLRRWQAAVLQGNRHVIPGLPE